jgi:hypothetical protein
MKTIIVGDIHGDHELVRKILAREENIIFIGDYLDSYQKFTSADELECLDLVLQAVTLLPHKVRALVGNHEMAYMDPRMSCSRMSIETHVGVMTRDMNALLDYIWLEDDLLISHAGISLSLLGSFLQTPQEYLDEGDFKQIGNSRGGYEVSGGLYWCDWWDEFIPVPGLRQVVGHSHYRPEGESPGIVNKGSNWNIDCLQRVEEVLLVKDGEVSYLTL